MTAGEHFEQVAVVYESLRTTDEAPVRRIGQLLPGRPVTRLDIGCGTGRYTRLLRALLPDGSLLVAADVSAALLAQLRAARRGHAPGALPVAAAPRRRAATAPSLPARPRPGACWVDEHLRVIVGGRRHNQVERDGPASPANQAIKDQALQISAGRAGQALSRRPGGRAQITPLSAQPIAGHDLRHSAQIGGYACGLPRRPDHAP